MTARYRADQVGSLLRPVELLDARRDAGDDAERLRATEDRHIRRVLAKQRELGFDVFTDGELRRRNFMSDFTDAVDGFDLADAVARSWKAGEAKPAGVSSVTGIVTAKLHQVRRLTGHELPFLRAESPGPFKVTLPSATQFPAISWKRGVTDSVYEDHSALLWDIVEIMKAEMASISGEGVAYLQIDAPRYSYFIDPKWRDWIRAEMDTEPAALLEESIRADNACLEAARRPGVTLAMHLCRGNNRSHWYAEGGYDAIAETPVREPGRRSLPARVRRRAIGNLRAAALRPAGQDGRARARELQAVAARESRRSRPPHRRGRPPRPAREPGPQSAVRLRLHHGREPPDGGRAVGEAPAGGRDRSPGMELRARERAAAAAFVLMAASATAQEPPRVIVNAANTATQIQRTAVLAIFMGEMTTWSDGKVIAPVDQSMRSPVRAAFSDKVLGKPAMSVQIHWLRRIAAEHVNPPPTKPSDAEVVAYVRANPGAIGYVAADFTPDETVKVVRVVASGAGER